ncbi:MAG: redox-regulated ATPase YchF [Deltaproteobacteria bacterium]|nr:redox-regulated ATPase YchF [Deltaproteobacteria bacterium]
MSLEVGIVGLPNVGKSTLFSAITKVKADAENYPFCTIEPNYGIVRLNDPRVTRLAEIMKPERLVPATLKVVDIAGLVKGASKGEGLGNKFLSNIREVDAIAHVVRCFEDKSVAHVEKNYDPVGDVIVVNTELILSDLEQVERKIERLHKQIKGDRDLEEELSVFEKIKNHLGEGYPAITADLGSDEKLIVSELNLLSMKPYIYIANVSENQLNDASDSEKQLRKFASQDGVEVIPICAKVEFELSEMDNEESDFFMEELGIDGSGIDQLTNSGYRMLEQITYFTAGKNEVRAWEIRKGTTAPEAAGKIHTDFEKGFIRAEVFHFDDIDRLGSESSVKEAGRWRLEGKDYVVNDGDIMHFRFNN